MSQSTTSKPPTLDVHDMYPAFSFLFNDDAKKVFANQCHYIVHQYNEPAGPWTELYNTIELLALLGIKSAENNPCQFVRQAVRVKFFGLTCNQTDLNAARLKLANAINDMASSKWLIASLYNLGTIELASDPLTPGTKRYAVFSYLAPFIQHEQAIDITYGWLQFQEGGLPPEFK